MKGSRSAVKWEDPGNVDGNPNSAHGTPRLRLSLFAQR